MASNSKKFQNTLTVVVAVAALLLAGVVVLVKTGVLSRSREEPEETVTETRIVEVSEVNENGEIIYYTIAETYVKPGISSNHRYPYTTKKTTTSSGTTNEEEGTSFVEVTEYQPVLDENGYPMFDENGELVTSVVTYTKPVDKDGNIIEEETTSVEEGGSQEETTGETTTTAEYYEVNGKVVTDRHGDPVTRVTVTSPFRRRGRDDTTAAPTTSAVTGSQDSSVRTSVNSDSASVTNNDTTKNTAASTTKKSNPNQGTAVSDINGTTAQAPVMSTSEVNDRTARTNIFDRLTPSQPDTEPVTQEPVTMPSTENIQEPVTEVSRENQIAIQ